jgi:hypothetical protein
MYEQRAWTEAGTEGGTGLKGIWMNQMDRKDYEEMTIIFLSFLSLYFIWSTW